MIYCNIQILTMVMPNNYLLVKIADEFCQSSLRWWAIERLLLVDFMDA